MATSTLAISAIPTPARAQELQPVVDVCTGISLPRSAVTEIIGAVNQPIVDQLETTVNGLTEVVLILRPLASITDLNIDLTTILANAEAGDPISLRIVDTEGNVLTAADDCNLTADAITLNEQAGISIGGNRITGLGTNGRVATAAEVDAIAFGDNASTAVGATGAVAIGRDANVGTANGVALGAASVEDRGAQTGYVAPGLAGTFSSVGAVSVGAAGSERQITNVAPGTADSDAATVGQVIGAVTAATADAVQYDGAARTTITLDGGAAGTRITNLSAGTLAAGSTDAVNGSQLFTTNQNVAANGAAIADNTTAIDANARLIADNSVALTELNVRVVGNSAAIDALDDRVTDNVTAIAAIDTRVGDNSTAIAANSTAIAEIDGRVGTVETDLDALTQVAVTYTDPTQTEVRLGGVGGTIVSNVAPGELSATSSEAVNGAQLFASNTRIAVNAAAIQANTDAIASVSGSGNPLGVVYDDTSRASITLDGASGTVIGNVADGTLAAGSTEAVNGGQLFTTNTRVAQNETDIADLDGRVTINEANIAQIDTRVAINETNIADLDNRVTVNEGDIANLDNRVTVNEADIADLDTRVATNTTNITNVSDRVSNVENSVSNISTTLANLPVGYVADADGTTPSASPTDTVALVAASGGAARLTNLAAGTLDATSGDAVNGSQLFATNQDVAANSDAIAVNSRAIASLATRIGSGGSGGLAALQYSTADNPEQPNGGVPTNHVTLVGAAPGEAVALHNVADGTSATDAVNLRQLQSGLANAQAMAEQYVDTQVAEALDTAMAYTDERFAQVNFDLGQVDADASAGTASAMSIAGLPQAMEAGGRLISGAIAHYRGETAWSFGLSQASADGKVIFKAAATLHSRGDVGGTVGAGIAF